MLRLAAIITLTAILNLSQAQILRSGYEDIFDPATRPVVINEKGIRTETNISLENEPRNTSGDCFYYWHRANKIMMTQGGYSGELLHGSYKSFYRSEQLKESGTFKVGLKHGKWTEWTENGYILKIVYWNKGIRHGETIDYDAKGEIKKVTIYANGKTINLEELKKREKKKLYNSFNYEIGDNDY